MVNANASRAVVSISKKRLYHFDNSGAPSAASLDAGLTLAMFVARKLSTVHTFISY